ncbi:hypothetical protein RBSH_05902 [Rhodopirellula baltica SH28]|uniref:Uncharacterized protein n=4 Tax=Rhodopirellula baltica TaxID=265606 RepID=Q7UVF1_RHOBA|nr:hypothetical protein RBWH47_05979 [Rhodopirellula baltica WH47]EKJ98844.1 hypothetical protein RBSH_05902 [Rhodopirellula baltica SH28]ELP31274.1 hypothetical protein RBSWK_04739 [Rhodopirellula baltica SWK14]CAD72773.1 hypothetical protein RB2675 [Rhodopirellula baltica SH 1]
MSGPIRNNVHQNFIVIDDKPRVLRSKRESVFLRKTGCRLVN